MLRALIWDVDGTLAETEIQGHRVAFNEAFAAAGLPWCWDEALYRRLLQVAGGRERILHYLRTARPPLPGRWRDPATWEELARRLHRDKNARYARLVAEGRIPLRPGVRRLLAEARAAGLRQAVATTTSPENVEALLRHALGAEAEGLFKAVVAGDMVPAKKPAPDAYLLALERLGLPAEACLALEDTPQGLAAARAAGLVTVVTSEEPGPFSGAALVVGHLGDPGRPAPVRDDPYRVLAAGGMVDLAALRRLHRAARGRG